jgi:hypothetical protein
VPFAHFVPASRAIVKWLSLFGVEIGIPTAFVAAALNAQPLPPHGQISAFAETPPISSGVAIAARQKPLVDWMTLNLALD